MQPGWTARVQQLPLPSRRSASTAVVATVSFTQENVRPPQRWRAHRRVIDARERSHRLVGVERRLNAIGNRKIETTSELDGMWQIFRCRTRLERFEIGQRPTRDVVNNLQELRRCNR